MAVGMVGMGAVSADTLDSDRASAADVLAMMARLPAVEVPHTDAQRQPGGFERIGVANALARAIADLTPHRQAASLMVVYAAYEGGNLRCAVGDGGASLGPYQLQDVPETIACDPIEASKVWIQKAKYSWRRCDKNPPEERLAHLASGSCDRGRALARRRDAIARRILTTDG